MKSLRRSTIAAMLFAVTFCEGCGGADAAVHLDSQMLLRRIKDGVLEIGRRHPREAHGSLMRIGSLRERIAGYEKQIEACEPGTIETVATIVDKLDHILVSRQSGATLTKSIAALVAAAEALPVEATPAAAYDD